MFDFDCANLITCVTILCIKLILECTVKESKIDMESGVVGPFARAALLGIDGTGACCGPFCAPSIVSTRAAIGREKYSWFVEYALQSNAIR